MKPEIIELLKSKPHNSHHLNRYIKFIDGCYLKNYNLDLDTYLEVHHILPKAQDLFIKYKDLRKHKWNSIKLTARQHIMAHIMLWKAYGGFQLVAIQSMLGSYTENNMKMVGRKIPESLKVRYWSKIREERKGKSVYKDPEGNHYFLHRDDSKIQELDLKGSITGFKFSEESKQVMSFRKKHLKLYLLNCIVSLKIDDPNFYNNLYAYESQGWVTEKTLFDKEYSEKQKIINKKNGYQRSSEKKKGRMRYVDQNGTFVGWFLKEDPEIQERNLKVQWTENNTRQVQERTKKSAKLRTGTFYFTNGIVEIQRKNHPGEDWIKGRLPRSDEHYRKQVEGLRKARTGKIVYNDGIKNFAVDPSILPEPHWIRGMRPRKKVV